MSKTVLLDAYVELNGVDVSDHVTSVEVSFKRDAVDSTAFGGGGGAEAMPGLKHDAFTLEVQQDFAASQINSILQPLYAAGTEFTVLVRYDSGSVSATNPNFTATVLLTEYTALSGKIGALSTTKVTLPSQRTGITMASS